MPNTEPCVLRLTKGRPPWALTIVSTIAGRIRASEPLEDPRQCLVRYADAFVVDLDHDLATGRTARELDPAFRLAVFDGVLEQCIERDPELLRIGAQRPVSKRSEPPAARGDLRPAHEDVFEKVIQFDLLELEEVRLVGAREQKQAVEDAFLPGELVERDVDLLEVPAVRAFQHLEMSARDRHRRPQLVRGVVEELLLPLERRLELVCMFL